ncbi:hypothetical protein [Reyranella sp.]|uniref:hypothetical protein n=1 Tax=Reyranella sp. TaxID=1929291 RepID=UPI003C79ECA9
MKKTATAGFALAFLCVPGLTHAQYGFDNPDALKAAQATLAAGGFPCGDVVSAVRRKDGNLLADCSNGRRYGMVNLGGGKISVVRFNPGTGEWVKP